MTVDKRRIIGFEQGVTAGNPSQGQNYIGPVSSDTYGRDTTSKKYQDQVTGAEHSWGNDERVGKRLKDWTVKEKAGIIIPMYKYPSDALENSTYDNIIELAKNNPNVPVTVILNPSSGPGVSTDGNFTATIERLQGASIKVIGYVSTNYTAVTIGAAKLVVDKWLELYPKIDGIFMDEMTNDVSSPHVTYYQNLTKYAHSFDLFPVVGNPGADSPIGYFETETADIILIHENSTLPTETQLNGNYGGGYIDYDYHKRGALVYNQSSYSVDTLNLLAKYTGWVYITELDLPNPWADSSSYLEYIFRDLNDRNSKVLEKLYIPTDTVVTIPFYLSSILPADYAPILAAKSLYPNTEMMVIFNPTAGYPLDEANYPAVNHPAYETAILALQAVGIKIIGYITTMYGGFDLGKYLEPGFSGYTRTKAEVKAIVDQWVSIHSSIDGIFLDEVANGFNTGTGKFDPVGTGTDIYNYYTDVNSYIRVTKSLSLTLLNTGTAAPEGMFIDAYGDAIIVSEDTNFNEQFISGRDTIPSNAYRISRTRKGVIIHSQTDLDSYLVDLARKYTKYLYFTDETGGGGGLVWNVLSSFLSSQSHILNTSLREVSTGTVRSDTLVLGDETDQPVTLIDRNRLDVNGFYSRSGEESYVYKERNLYDGMHWNFYRDDSNGFVRNYDVVCSSLRDEFSNGGSQYRLFTNDSTEYNPTLKFSIDKNGNAVIENNLTVNGTINGLIANNSITTAMIQDSAIIASKMAVDSVNSSALVNSAVTADKIAANSINSSKIADGTIVAADIASATVLGSNIALGTVTSSNILNGTVLGSDIANNTIANANMATDSVGSNNIIIGSVTNIKIGANAVTTDKITDGTILGSDLANNTLSDTQIAVGGIGSASLAANSVNSSEIVNGAVTDSKVDISTISLGTINEKVLNAGVVIDGATIKDGVLLSDVNTTIVEAVVGSFSITVLTDQISEYTLNNGVSIDGVSIKDGNINNNNVTAVTVEATQVLTDTIHENSPNVGVLVDSVLLKDNTVTSSSVSTDIVNEKTLNAGVTIDSVLVKDNTVNALTIITDTITEKTATNGVDIDGVLLKDGGISFNSGTTIFKEAVFDIGDWNMNTTANVSVAISSLFPNAAAAKKIRTIKVHVRDDLDEKLWELQTDLVGGGSVNSGHLLNTIATPTIILYRQTAGYFDTILYQDISYNRGWVTVKYIV